MADLPLNQIICGIPELAGHARSRVTHVISILDPAEPEPLAFADYPPHDRLTLRFDDVIEPIPSYAPPMPEHIEQLLRFGREIGAEALQTLLIHCHAGVSRSTASATALLLQAFPELSADKVLDHIGQVRPQAWPNSRMIGFADEQLGRGGTLVAALNEFYRRRLAAEPGLADMMRGGSRGAEVERATRKPTG
jgi:predicted protein tyrosine phosphatase